MAVNWWAIVVAAVVKFAIGAIWYAPLFGRQWRALQGIPEGSPQTGLVQAMVVQIIGDLIMAYILARFIGHYGMTGVGGGLFIAFMAWLGFVATIMVGSIFYEKKPPQLIAINAGYQLVGILAMGAILGVWR
jgi:hypothetical protein